MPNRVTTIQEYLRTIPLPQRRELEKVRKVIRARLPRGYKETMQYGMIAYVVPLSRYASGYLEKKDVPLPYIALAAQKNYCSLYLLGIYGNKEDERWFKKAYEGSGKKLDMGKSCVRFRKADDLALNIIGKAVARKTPAAFIEAYAASRSRKRKG